MLDNTINKINFKTEILRCLPPHKEEKTFQLWISKFTLTEQGQSLNVLVHKQFEFTSIQFLTKWVLRICSLSKSKYFDKIVPSVFHSIDR